MKLDTTDRVTHETTRWKVHSATYDVVSMLTCWPTYDVAGGATRSTTEDVTYKTTRAFMRAQS